MKPVDEVLALLPVLTGSELEQVKQQINMLRAVGPSTQQQVGDEAMELLQAIVMFLSSKGLEYNSAVMLRQISQYSVFADKAKNVFRFMRGIDNRTQKRAFLLLAVELLYKDLTAMGIAVSARTVMSHVHRIPAVVNKSFPFYAKSGLLKMIVRNR